MNTQNKPIEELLHTLADQPLPEDISQLADEEMVRFSRAIELLERQKPTVVLWMESVAQWLAHWSHRVIASTAVLTLIVVGGVLLNMPQKAIAWSDVRRAFATVSHVHISAILYDPQQVTKDDDSPPDYEGLEFYYQFPNQYRGHGRGLVHFVTHDVSRVYNTEDKAFLASDDYRRIIPEALLQAEQQGTSLLDIILMLAFQGNVPEKEPVLNTTLPVESGIEIFDYAHSGVDMWARIWVLKETQLPLRVKMHTPRWNETTLLVFDYSDPKPDRFFDITYFEDKARSGNNRKSHQFYRIGDEQIVSDQPGSVKKKATNAAQVYDIQGIVPPQFKRIEVSDNGDLLIVAKNPENLNQNGGHIEGYYRDELQDNWGNVYHRYYKSHDWTQEGDTLFAYYTPMPPFRPGDGEHRLTLLYTTWGYQGGLGYDQIIEEKEVVIPQTTVEGIPDTWYQADSARKPFWKLQAYRLFMAGGGMGTVAQMAWVDQILAEHPESSQILDYKLRLIEKLEGPDAAFVFFKEHRLDTLMQEEDYTQCMYNEPLKKYMLHLYNSDQRAEFNRLQQHFLKKQSECLSSKDRDAKFSQDRIKNFEGTLSRILYIPQAVEQIRAGNQPELVNTILSRDGVLFVEMNWPEFAKGQDFRQVFNGPYVDKATLVANDFLEAHSLYQFQTSEKDLTFTFKVAIEPFLPIDRRINDGLFTRVDYPITIQVPPASDKTADQIRLTLARWRPALAKREDAQKEMSEITRLQLAGWRARQAGEHEQAIAHYRGAMACDLPEDLLKLGPVEDIKNGFQARFMLNMAQCYLDQGDTENALDLAHQVQDLATDKTDRQPHYLLADTGSARQFMVQIASQYIEQNQLARAEALLEEIGKSHPDLRRLRDLRLLKQRSNGTYTWDDAQRRSAVHSQWQGYYRAVWQLTKAKTSRVPL